MGLYCELSSHDEVAGLLDENGNWYQTWELVIPLNGKLEIYFNCLRCGRIRKAIEG